MQIKRNIVLFVWQDKCYIPTVADAEQGWNTERSINKWEPYPKICLFLHQKSCLAGMSECRHNFWNGFHIFCSSLLSKFLQLI